MLLSILFSRAFFLNYFYTKHSQKYFSLFAINMIRGTFSFPPLMQQRYNVLLVKMLKKNSGALKPGFSSENTSCRYYYSRCPPHSPSLPIRITFFHGVLFFANVFHRRSHSFFAFRRQPRSWLFRQLATYPPGLYVTQLYPCDVILSHCAHVL